MATKMQIELNVNRTRITVLGFDLTLIVFATGLLISVQGVDWKMAIWWHLPAFVSFFLAFVSAMLAIWLLVMAQGIHREGGSDLVPFSVGEGLMFIALSQTLAGLSKNFIDGTRAVFGALPGFMEGHADRIAEVQQSSSQLLDWLYWIGGIAWFLMIYVAPISLLMKNPLPRRTRVFLLGGYFLILLVVFWVLALAYHVQLGASDEPHGLLELYLWQWWQPHLWIP